MEFSYKKFLGQNFIFDLTYLRKMVEPLRIQPHDLIVEIGAGAGTLTEVLSGFGCRVSTFEIDQRLIPILENKFEQQKNIEIYCTDALKFNFNNFETFRVIANVPYYITTPLIMKFLSLENCNDINILIAKEVAERIVAPIGTAEYGALSVTCQLMADCKIIKFVPRTLFTPQPKIDSAFIQILKKQNGLPEDFENFIKQIFAARRKTILNALLGATKLDKAKLNQILEEVGIAPTHRPEQIEPTQYDNIYRILRKLDK